MVGVTRSGPVLARKPSRRPGRCCIRLSRDLEGALEALDERSWRAAGLPGWLTGRDRDVQIHQPRGEPARRTRVTVTRSRLARTLEAWDACAVRWSP